MSVVYSKGCCPTLGAETLGYSSMVHGMFPGGGVDLVNYFYGQCNSKLDESLKAAIKAAEENQELWVNSYLQGFIATVNFMYMCSFKSASFSKWY